MKNNIFTVENAVILAAGFSSRFAPLSRHTPKALLEVRGEVLIERQIRQLQEKGIHDIYIVTGYLKERFEYLRDKLGVYLIENSQYQSRNNHSSIWAARDILSNTYICCSDNYFTENLFTSEAIHPYYAAQYSNGPTDEYCLTVDSQDRIINVTIGGSHSWYMLGHVLFDQKFSTDFLHILEQEYDLPETVNCMWENIYMKHLDELTLYIKKYPPHVIREFDTVKELALFDPFYRRYLNE
ncbi:MAG: NTP transferase domain-containing protein [Ruminococcus sp.]|jgi:CTP:phosphocholine cytidylyltransferase-like protein